MADTKGKTVDQNSMESRQLKVELKATKGHPHIAAGTLFKVHPAQKDRLLENGWAVEKGESDDIAEDKIKKPKTHGDNASEAPGIDDEIDE